ncbi:MAG: hypothetical protein BGO71_25900 [Burkholderiales bacterium 67-32]|nr:MAG: hypothetical protein BGO71_25900 [Burkholderiales bacterium 67-32]
MASCADADVVVVADTGSTDGGIERLEALGACVHRLSIEPWRFDDARNAALALVPGEVDVCVSLDLDEILCPGWRRALEAAWVPGTTRAHYDFVSAFHADGSPAIRFLNNRIHARHGYRWRHACHEGIYPDRIAEQGVLAPGMRVEHHPDRAKPRASYLPLLAAAAAEEPHDPRMAHYHARELFHAGRHEEAAREFERCLALPGNLFRPERSAGMLYLAKCEMLQGGDGLDWALRAAVECPERREPWVTLADIRYRRGEWAECRAAAVRGLSLAGEPDGYMSDPVCHGALPHDLAAIANWRLGRAGEALAHAQEAVRMAPGDERLRANVELIRQTLREGGVSANTAGRDCPPGQPDAVRALAASAPDRPASGSGRSGDKG